MSHLLNKTQIISANPMEDFGVNLKIVFWWCLLILVRNWCQWSRNNKFIENPSLNVAFVHSFTFGACYSQAQYQQWQDMVVCFLIIWIISQTLDFLVVQLPSQPPLNAATYNCEKTSIVCNKFLFCGEFVTTYINLNSCTGLAKTLGGIALVFVF